MSRKLIEVALPLEAINRESAREKSIRHGHPSTLHLWWARRPLAACRAIVFASMVDDPSAHPERFPTEEAQEAERQRLFAIIEDLVAWENTTNETVLGAARAEIERSCGPHPPPVMDPFCGGGSIPLEAQRLGLEAAGSDLNPVAVLITKALVELPARIAGRPPVHPDGARLVSGAWRGAQGLAEDVRHYGGWMRDEARRRIGSLYPQATLPDGSRAPVIAWLWARTVRSPNPAWNGPMPLVRSFALSTKPGRECWVEPVINREARTIGFEVRSGPGWPDGTVSRNGAVCLATGTPVPLSYVRAEGRAGRMGAQLMAIVAAGHRGRIYLPPDPDHEHIARSAVSPADAPDSDLPDKALGFRVQGYGMTKHRHLFTDRQLVAICTFADLVGEARQRVLDDGGSADYADAVATYLGLGASKSAAFHCTMARWRSGEGKSAPAFGRQAMSMVWDYCEVQPFAGAGGDLAGVLGGSASAIVKLPVAADGNVLQLDATAMAPERPVIFLSDPPYYDNIGYADLSDFFFVWLRRSLRAVHPDLFSTLLVPKTQELVADPYRHGGDRRAAEKHFEAGIGAAFERMRQHQAPGFPLTVIYAFKQAEEAGGPDSLASTGWETMLEGLMHAGLSIHGTWPLRTEGATRVRGLGSNALASSIALVCRPRPPDAPLATRKDFLAALRAELPQALRALQQGSIAPVDLAQSAIGPGMGVFSRYAKVVEADGRAMAVRTALGLINSVLDETLSEQEGDFDADTRWALAWFEESGMSPGPYGQAETLSKAKNTSLAGLVAAGFVESRAGKVRLLDRREYPAGWDPATDTRLTVWEVAQHLIARLDAGGEAAAADLLRRVGGLGETAKELAYRLYVTCERRKWAKEALAYNAIVVAWPEISRLAGAVPAPAPVQQELL